MKAERKSTAKSRMPRLTKDDPAELRALMKQPGQITRKRAEELEIKVQRLLAPGAGGSQYRRLGFGLLEQSGRRLIEIATQDREAGEMLADAVGGIASAAKRLRSLADLLSTSAIRVMVALCVREDAIELLTAARVHHNRDGAEAAND